MLKISNLNVGDILAFRPASGDFFGGAISFLSNGGKYCHVARYLGDGMIIESTLLGGGVKTRTIEEKELFLVDVYSIPSSFFDTRMNKAMIDYEMRQVGKGYGLLDFPSTFIKSVLSRLFGFNHFAAGKPVLNNKNTFYCSELHSSAFDYVFRKSPVAGLHYMCVTPNDLCGSKSVYKQRKF